MNSNSTRLRLTSGRNCSSASAAISEIRVMDQQRKRLLPAEEDTTKAAGGGGRPACAGLEPRSGRAQTAGAAYRCGEGAMATVAVYTLHRTTQLVDNGTSKLHALVRQVGIDFVQGFQAQHGQLQRLPLLLHLGKGLL